MNEYPYTLHLDGCDALKARGPFWPVHIAIASGTGEVWYTDDDGMEFQVWRDEESRAAISAKEASKTIRKRVQQLKAAAA